MHIPDGFLTTPVWGSLDAFSAPAVAWIARRAQKTVDTRRIPLMGVMGAFIFAAQMINFPVGNGTSGHLVGGALLAFTLGPAAATIVMTAILATQSLVFQDGGILALGTNVFNMAIAGVLAGYLPYAALKGSRAGVFLGAMLSLLVSALLALTELRISGVPMPPAVLGVSLALFVVSAIVEGGITVLVVQSLEKMQPGILRQPRANMRLRLLGGVAVILVIAGVFIASAQPDGIESFARRTGIWSQVSQVVRSPLAGYQFAWVSTPWLAKVFAGLAGLVVAWGACAGISRLWLASRSPLNREGA